MEMVGFFRNARIFLVVLVLLIVIDGIVIGMFLSDFYTGELVGSARVNDGMLKPKWLGVGIIYLIIAWGLTYYVVLRNERESEAGMFLKGALFGLVIYGIYNTANYSLLKEWPLNIVFIDTLWGTALCGVVAVGAYMVEKVVGV